MWALIKRERLGIPTLYSKAYGNVGICYMQKTDHTHILAQKLSKCGYLFKRESFVIPTLYLKTVQHVGISKNLAHRDTHILLQNLRYVGTYQNPTENYTHTLS